MVPGASSVLGGVGAKIGLPDHANEALATGAPAEPSLDDLANFDFTEEAFDDPLGIAMSWEEKYKKKTPAEEAAEAGGEAKP